VAKLIGDLLLSDTVHCRFPGSIRTRALIFSTLPTHRADTNHRTWLFPALDALESDGFLNVQGFGNVVEAAMNFLEGLKHLPEHVKNNSPECDYGEQENDANETLYHGKHLVPRAEFTPAG
jgi:hypothetical protein